MALPIEAYPFVFKKKRASYSRWGKRLERSTLLAVQVKDLTELAVKERWREAKEEDEW